VGEGNEKPLTFEVIRGLRLPIIIEEKTPAVVLLLSLGDKP
jgi:hypothetical protein